MGKELLSAYELATKRIIVSNYGERMEAEEKRRKAEQEELDALPEFIDAWERPDKGESPSPLIDAEEDQSRFYTQAEIKAHQQKNAPNIEELQYMTPLQEKETIACNKPPMEVHWYGHFTSYSGFSRLNRAMAFGLSNRNVKVKVDIQESTVDINEPTQRELQMLSKMDVKDDAPKVYGATVPLRLAHAGRKVLYTMMETSQTLHDQYVGRINLYNEIWVPTEFGKKLFKNNGVLPPIYVMPLGVDTLRYHPNTPPMNFDFGLKRFVFISVFKWGYRKGYDILLKAFLEEFSSQDDVSLLIVSRTDVHHKPELIAQDFAHIRNGIIKDDSELPHVALYDKPVKERDMPKFYAAADAFVLISRGEGFGLPYYEAAASGLPVIGSNCSGQMDLLSSDSAYLVEPDSYEQAKIGGNMSNLAKHCGFYEDQVFPNFGRPAIEATKEYMRRIYDDYDSAQIKAAILGKKVRENYTWDMAIDRVYKRLKEIS
jgi:glycosyltransferase involved in cell wall biosynthesis